MEKKWSQVAGKKKGMKTQFRMRDYIEKINELLINLEIDEYPFVCKKNWTYNVEVKIWTEMCR